MVILGGSQVYAVLSQHAVSNTVLLRNIFFSEILKLVFLLSDPRHSRAVLFPAAGVCPFLLNPSLEGVALHPVLPFPGITSCVYSLPV